jgi:hypothetical protein
MKQFIVCVLICLIAGLVVGENGAHCEGNVLVFYDLFNKATRRDCSILHSGQGQVFRGECRSFDGGADCWRTQGAVTPEYRDAVRGFTYNSSVSPWNGPYQPSTTTTTFPWPAKYTTPTTLLDPNVTVTTTTLQEPDFVCATLNCSVCGITYNEINISFDGCRRNLALCNSRMGSSYSSEEYNKLISNFKSERFRFNVTIAQCARDLALEKSTSSTYFGVMILSIVILGTFVLIWVKYEWIGDPKFKEYFDVKPRIKK